MPCASSAEPPLTLSTSELRALIREVVGEVLAETRDGRGPLCYTEEQAARLLRLLPHQLRDERLRGGIAASAIVGRRVRYLPADLENYLARRRVQASPARG